MSDLPGNIDVLVIGGGNAAMAAAMTARAKGASVLVLEAAPKDYRGGNTRHTRNIRYAHMAATEYVTGAYTPDEYWEDLLRVTQGKTDEDMTKFMIAKSEDSADWMASHGVKFQPPLSGTLSLGRTNAFFKGGGKALMNAYYVTAERMGVTCVYDAEVTDLMIEDGVFTYATVLYKDQEFQVSARAVVVASGGFEANIEWLKEGWGEAAENFRIRGTEYNKGKMLRVLLDRGAVKSGEVDQCHAVAIDARAPRFDGGIATRVDCVCYSIVVNKDAVRFYDEGEDFWPKRYAIWGRLVAAQKDQIAYSIIDEKSQGLFMPTMFPPIQADSIGELAAKLDLDPAALEKTVTDYNAAVQPGTFQAQEYDDCKTDDLNPPKTHWARKLDQPPYYAYPLRPGITFTYLGVKVDKEARVYFEDKAGRGKAAANVFAAGEIMSGNILGQGYAGGTGMAIGLVFGRIAGQEAAHRAVN